VKKLLSILFISILLFSCRKEKNITIVGSWRENAEYIKNSSGEFYWFSDLRFPLMLTLAGNGQYSAFDDMPAGYGNYQYNYSTHELKFEDPAGNLNVHIVSYLDENYLIIDYIYNNELFRKRKFSR
jgi:hypothetical protein